jgi:hypothetical protein
MPINPTIALLKGESYSQLHSSLQNIIFIMHEFESNCINHSECLEKVSQAIAIIEEYNAVACKLNIEFWKIRTPTNIRSFESVNIRQETSDQKNIINYTLSHPDITLMLLKKGVTSRLALLDTIEQNHLGSLGHLIDYAIKSDGDSRLFGITINQLMDKAVDCGSTEALRVVLEKFRKTVPSLDNQCLIRTIIKGDLEKFTLLLKYDINVQQENEEHSSFWDGFSPIEIATLLKRPLYIKALAEKGAIVNETAYPSLLPDLLTNLSTIRGNTDYASIFHCALILIKYGLDLSNIYDNSQNIFSQAQKHLHRNLKKTNIAAPTRAMTIKTSQLLTDVILLTKTSKIARICANEREAINAVFFDLYALSFDADSVQLTSKFFTIPNLRLLAAFLQNSTHNKTLENLVKKIYGFSIYFNLEAPKHPCGLDTPSPLSLIPKKQLDKHLEKRDDILTSCRRALFNIECTGQFLFKNHADHLFEHVCEFLDGPSQASLARIQ